MKTEGPVIDPGTSSLVAAMQRRIEVLEEENERLRMILARSQYELAVRVKFDEESG